MCNKEILILKRLRNSKVINKYQNLFFKGIVNFTIAKIHNTNVKWLIIHALWMYEKVWGSQKADTYHFTCLVGDSLRKGPWYTGADSISSYQILMNTLHPSF